jgi:acetamidase/formamidase
MTTYHLEPERATLHGHFSSALPPVLTISPGDTVTCRTLDAAWSMEPRGLDGWNKTRTFAPREPEKDDGHALIGPIAVQAAEPGMTLSVRFDAIVPDTWGWTFARVGEREEDVTLFVWELDPAAMTGRNQHGHTVALRPFMGVAGNSVAEAGIHGTGPPRPVGGNMDCKELVAGSTLYLPIAVSGAMFSVGDGHAAQGDGESSGTAIECPLSRLQMTFGLHPDLHLTTPRAETPAGWLTLGFDTDLNKATEIALSAMVDLIAERYNISLKDALALASVVVDLRITQIVNGVRGVHAVLPHGAIQ